MKIRKLALLTFAIGMVLPLSSCFIDDLNPFKKDDKNPDQTSHTHTFVEKHDNTNHWLECECGEIKDKSNHALEVSSTTQANCEHGLIQTYTCSCGYSYSDDDQNKVHNFECHHDETSHWCECKDCGITTSPVNHTFEFLSTIPATCEIGEQTIFKCTECDYQKTEETSLAKGHHIVTTISKVATCQEDGLKVYSCTDCDYRYEEVYSDKDAHCFDKGVTNNDVTTYSCVHPGCDHSYDVISFKEETSATIDSSVLSEIGAVELKEATIKFDEQTLSTLSSDVTISAEKVSTSVIEDVASEKTKEILKDAPIYQFSLNDGGEDVHIFSGEVEVSLPYTLGENEDPDSISILYIDEDGETQSILAYYANGFVSFKTIHFSIYAVVVMPREEMCKQFGHNYRYLKETESTCVKHGHTYEVCVRCGDIHKSEKELLEHRYEFSALVPSTEKVHGYTVYKCRDCGDEYTCELPLLTKEDSSFYVNLIRSISTSNLKMDVEIKCDNETVEDVEEYICTNSDYPFMLEIENKSRFILIDETGSYNYSKNSIHHWEDDTLNLIKVIFDTVSSAAETFGNLVDFVFDVAERVLLTKEDRENEIVLKIDMEKVSAFMDDLKVLTAEEIVEKYIGETFLQNVLDFVEDSYDRTVQATINALVDKGIIVKDIFTFVNAILGEELDYDEIFTNDFLKENTYDFLCDFTGLDIPDFDDLKSLVDEFKGLKLYEIIKEFDDSVTETEDEFWDEIMEGFEEFKEGFKCELITTKAGQFKKLDVIYPHPYYVNKYSFNINTGMGVEEYLHYDFNSQKQSVEEKITITTNFDVNDAKAIANKTKADVNAILEVFDFTNESSVMNMLNEIYGVKFTVAEKNEDYTGYISEPTTKYNGLYSGGDQTEKSNTTSDSSNIKGQIYVVISNNVYPNPVENINPNGDEEMVWAKSINMIFNRVGIVFYEESSNGDKKTVDTCNLVYPSGNFILNENSGETSYSLLDQYDHYTIRRESNYAEFHKQYPWVSIDKEDINKLVFYKETCKYCDREEFYIFLKEDNYYWHRNGGVINSPYMDEEARKYRISLYQNDYDRQEKWQLDVSSYYFSNFHISDITREEQKDISFNCGNVSISIKYSNESNCSRSYKETITIDIGGMEKITKINYFHDSKFYDSEKYESRLISESIDGCVTHSNYGYFCKECGELVHEEMRYSQNHQFEPATIIAEPTLTLPGVEVTTCSICGETRYNVIYPHQHYVEFNYDTNTYFCPLCEKVFEDYDFVDYAVEKVEYDVYEDYWDENPCEDYFFSVKNLIGNYWRDDYNDVLTIAWVDPNDYLNDDGSLKIDPEYALSMPLYNYNYYYISVGDERYSTKEYTQLYRFSKVEYDAMASKAEAEGRIPVYQVIIPDHMHKYLDEYSSNEIAHWHQAICGHDVKADYEQHTFDENNVCTVCGYEQHIEEKITYEKVSAYLLGLVEKLNDYGLGFIYDESYDIYATGLFYDQDIDPENYSFLEEINQQIFIELNEYLDFELLENEQYEDENGLIFYNLKAVSNDENKLELIIQSYYDVLIDEDTEKESMVLYCDIYLYTELTPEC